MWNIGASTARAAAASLLLLSCATEKRPSSLPRTCDPDPSKLCILVMPTYTALLQGVNGALDQDDVAPDFSDWYQEHQSSYDTPEETIAAFLLYRYERTLAKTLSNSGLAGLDFDIVMGHPGWDWEAGSGSYPYDADLGSDMDAAIEDAYLTTNLETVQAEAGADVVMLVAGEGFDANWAGRAWTGIGQFSTPLLSGSGDQPRRRALGVVDLVQMHAFVHELGHILGAKHDKNEDPDCALPYPSSAPAGFPRCGYRRVADDWMTIMSYFGNCTTCSRDWVFSGSDPGDRHRGSKVGVAGESNNRCIVEQMWHYRARISDLPDQATLDIAPEGDYEDSADLASCSN